jgi:putative aldouronate transport system permease protein
MGLRAMKTDAAAAPARRRRRRFSRDDLELTLIGLPAALWFVAFCYLPMFGVIIAFKQYRPRAGSNFFVNLLASQDVGFNNFKFLFATPDAGIMFRNTLLYNAVFIVLGIVVAVSLAILISQLHSRRLAKVCQTAMFLPNFLSWVVVSYFVFSFLSTDKGFVTQVMKAMGLPPVQWYMESRYWPFFLVLVNLWKNVGYSMVVYLASIAGIDESLYEAATIDGARKWQQVRYITIPMLVPIVTIMFILAVGGIFSSDFGLFYQVPRNSGPITNVTQTIDVYVYKALMNLGNIGFASAAGLMQSVFGLITIVTANFIVRRIDPENSLF